MCYEERLFRSWETTKKARKHAENLAAAERDRSEVKEAPAAQTPEANRRKEVERELEEIV